MAKKKAKKKKAAKKKSKAVVKVKVGKGRPTKYKKAFNEEVRKLCLLRATDIEIADFFSVTEATITTWKKKHPDFLVSIKEGKIKADATIADSLYQRAKGYEHEDVHISNYKGKITKTKIIKHYPPDTAAAFIWLKNRTSKFRDVLPDPPNTGQQITKIIVEYASEYVPERKQIESVVIEQGE